MSVSPVFARQVFTRQVCTHQVFTRQVFTHQVFTRQVFTVQVRAPCPRKAAGCYPCAAMGCRPAKSRPNVTAQLVVLPAMLIALACCATPGSPGASDQDKPLYPGP